MKKSVKIAGYTTLGIIAVLYLAFLFVLPNVINLEEYMPLVKSIVKEQSNLDIEINNPKIITSPFLEAGLKTDGIKISLPDGSPVLDTGAIKAKVFLPSALLLTVKVSCLDVNDPKINLDINEKGNQYKLVRELEKILTAKKDEVKEETEESFFNPAWIRIKVPNVKVLNYSAAINDIKNNHHLTIKGDELLIGYFNGKRATLKTYAYLLSDDKTNITANVKFDTFLPEVQPQEVDLEDDKAQKVEFPFINIVEIYQNYDLTTHVNSKLKIRPTHDKKSVKMRGFFNVDNLTLKLADYTLPKCYFHSKMRGTTLNLDTNLYISPDEHTNISGRVNYRHPAIDLNISGDKIYLNNVIKFTRALLDSFGISNDFANLKGEGYFLANANIKTNFKKLKSSGSIIIRNGSLKNNKIGLVITDTNADLLFDDNVFRINNTRTFVGSKPLTVSGSIDNKARSDLKISTKNLPITGLYRAMAPSNIKSQYNMTSGDISIDAKLYGKLKQAVSTLDFDLSNLTLAAVDNSLKIENGNFNIKVLLDLKEDIMKGKIVNSGLGVIIPASNSRISDEKLVVDFDKVNIDIQPTNLLINSNSSIGIKGGVMEYASNPQIGIAGSGSLNAADLRKLCGDAAAPYIDVKGSMPVKFSVTGNAKKQAITAQVLSDAQNFITPVHFKNIKGAQCISQLKVNYKGDRLNIKDTGIYTTDTLFTDDLSANMAQAQPVVKVHGTLAKLNTNIPSINLLKVEIPKTLNGTIYALKRSAFNLDGNMIAFGRIFKPIVFGGFNVTDLRLPTLLTSIKKAGISFNNRSFRLFADAINLNGSDINFSAHSNIDFAPVIKLYKLSAESKNFNLDKVMKVSDAAMKTLPAAPQSSSQASSAPADIPLEITSGRFNFNKIQTGNIVLNNTRGQITLHNNTVFIKPVFTNIFNGHVNGNISMNLITSALDMDLKGSGINTEKALKDAANMSDALSGTTSFNMKAQMKGSTYEEQMKSLKGTVNFKIKDGSLGPCGKLENMILAENIRESKFFETTLGGIVGGLATIDTAHYEELSGKMSFKNGCAIINPITSKGNVMCIHISGTFDLLKNEADMKVRGKLASMISNMLGPIAALNPINLLKATPGINVAMAKAFSIFTVAITQEEMDAIPSFGKNQSELSATKFQIVLQGDVAKPLSMIKSFKWLAVQSDIDNAQSFADNMPEEYLLADPTTPEAQAAAEAKAKEDAKPINRLKRKLNIGQSSL
ncbi:MAG: hypothetical protein LUB59_02280 [Candidatus Gastranaerophilales bacterium]|nr:hypothetical protein [Candidatus Gastranaerophilales bacterium]